MAQVVGAMGWKHPICSRVLVAKSWWSKMTSSLVIGECEDFEGEYSADDPYIHFLLQGIRLAVETDDSEFEQLSFGF